MVYAVIISTTDSKSVALEISSSILKSGLSPCVQIDVVDSYFKWEGEIKSAKEYRLMVKAKKSNYQAIEQLILQAHNYELPEVLQLDITGGSDRYLKWIG